MGAFSVLIPDRSSLADYSLKTSHMVGFDGVPWQCEQALVGDRLIITRQESESGNLCVPWKVNGNVFGLTTGTLCERTKPYLLPVELSRGTINRIRNQLAAWKLKGFSPNRSTMDILANALNHMAVAATSQSDSDLVVEQTTVATRLAIDAINELTEQYIEHHRQQDRRTSAFWFGFELDIHDMKVHRQKSNVASIPMTWNQIEMNQDQFEWGVFDVAMAWCKQNNLSIMSGQFFDPHREAFPDWLYLWQDQKHSIESLLRRFVTNAVERYSSRVHLWHCHAGTMGQTKLGLDEEDQLRLTVAVIESVRQVDKTTPLLLTIEQPFGEYLVRDDLDLSPIQFADMLARAGIGVTGFNLRLNFGTDLAHTLIRDPFEIGRLIDMWSLLGKPLVVQIGVSDLEKVGTTADSIQRIVDLIATKTAVQGILFDRSLQSRI